MRKYPLALDAAPQDGRWLDDPAAVKTVLAFLVSKLSPADRDELDAHLSEGTEPQAADHRLVAAPGLARDLLRYTPRNRRALLDNLSGAPRPGGCLSLDAMRRADPQAGKPFAERFPDAGGLRS